MAGSVQGSLSAIFFIVPRRILPERVLGRRSTTIAQLEGGHRADAVAHQRHHLALDLGVRRG